MILFPHEEVREVQDELIKTIDSCLKNKKNLVVHAPTGLGKTVSALVPALTMALEKELTVFFLTSKHTQHKIAIDTVKKMQAKYGKSLHAVSLLGKKWYCLQQGSQSLPSKEFAEYCRSMVQDDKCEFYMNVKPKGKISVDAKRVMEELKDTVNDSKDVIQSSSLCKLCPYEITLMLAKNAKLIITDYYYLFNPSIRKAFFKRIDGALEKAIIIVDEAHNLPSRVKDLASEYLSLIVVERALKEAKRYASQDIVEKIAYIQKILVEYGKTFYDKTLNALDEKNEKNSMFDEKYVAREAFMAKLESLGEYDALAAELSIVGDNIREEQQHSYIGSIARFLSAWKEQDEGFTRILSKKEKNVVLSYRCLDPSLITKEPLNGCYASVLMSGTLTPTTMYRELLGLENCEEKTLRNPFPKINRLNIIIPKTSTKYDKRTKEQYIDIAAEIDKIAEAVPGNVLVFFPSYYLKDSIKQYFKNSKTVLDEYSGLSKEERNELLEKFKSYKNVGSLLLAVTSGSFGEGIDLPGDEVKAVINVGLPLQKPDLEAKSLIEYYDKKFGKGWDYGYVFPAFTKTIQSAGRCIRSKTDKGVIVFLDERFAWPQYKRCFPLDWDLKISLLHEKMIGEFFREPDGSKEQTF